MSGDGGRPFYALITGYLRERGWREIEPGRWIEPGARMLRATRTRPRRPSCGAYYSLTAAVQRELDVEFRAFLAADKQRIESGET